MEEKIMLLVNSLGEREEYPSRRYHNIIICNEEILSKYFKANIPIELRIFSETFGAFSFKNGISAKGIKDNRIADKNGCVPVNYFVAISGNINTMMHLYMDYKDQLSRKFLPFCEGTSGDLIGVSLKKKDFGKIYYWFHESEEGKEYILIANNFYELLQNLFIEEEVGEEEEEKNKEIDENSLKGLSPQYIELLRKSGIIK
ncbi:SMI1/KNR4 family protein [Emticicia sp. C21]|uniref:SMI1/KNR4 family protein n=1 Tax=Emticicia sp. C21 TaxID=2302915 RepID=UPI000E3463C1|nr:SMI1/KNR4 family protein [Emticicia sp. C21]RFS14940.1 hypothetical protein D0T08_17790 [Emticicia sp. C21]